ncbi:hypothetical protein SADUNF_Sadunf04G0037300 [Salix dunnii]|uniref:Uncharacterized protein n=1 Tax=Salix dunnii TaxID=1413687 RepID=A0A835K6R9_9ROSI|nr:hypothetical protein SADUNF_Sadunf04G0037300 [Salix dunnii]
MRRDFAASTKRHVVCLELFNPFMMLNPKPNNRVGFVRSCKEYPTMATVNSESLQETQAAAIITDSETAPKPQAIYRCKRCRRIVASEENIVPHERGKGEQCFKWNKKSVDSCKNQEPPECSSIFVEPMKWMQTGKYMLQISVLI